LNVALTPAVSHRKREERKNIQSKNIIRLIYIIKRGFIYWQIYFTIRAFARKNRNNGFIYWPIYFISSLLKEKKTNKGKVISFQIIRKADCFVE